MRGKYSTSLAILFLFGPIAALWPATCATGDEPKPAPTAEEYRQFITESAGKQFYGVYMGDKKTGWFSEEQMIGEHEGKEAAVMISNGLLKMNILGAQHVMEFRGVRKYAVAGDGDLLYVEDETIEDGVKTVHVGRIDGDRFSIATTSGLRTSKRTADRPKETLRRSIELDRWLAAGRTSGETFDSFTVSVDEADINIRETLTFNERLTIPYGGVPTEVNRVNMADSRGISFDCELADDGRMLKGKMGPLDIRAEEAVTAQKLDVAILDSLVNIKIDRDLGDPELVDSLVLEVEGLGAFKFPQSHRQKLRPGENGATVLELSRDRRADPAAPLTDDERAKNLLATPSIQADSEDIRELAKDIVEDSDDGKDGEVETIEAVDRLREWVYENLKKSMASNSSTALQVLDRKAGDCTEHTLLFVALARAAGIPAREVGGVAFTNYEGPIFGWHAWAQIHDGEQWVTVDPTWNQTYVDATHIQLQDHADDMQWINLLGELKLKVVEFEAREEE